MTTSIQSVDELDKLAEGYTSTIFRIPLEHKVVKVLDKEWVEKERRKKLYERELAAYQRMSKREDLPNSVLKFFGPHPAIESGIVLELAERSSLDRYLWEHHEPSEDEPPPERYLLLRWAEQLSEALSFVHSCDILHCDIYAANCFLDGDLNLKLGDFGACALDGGRPTLTYRRTHQLWTFDKQRDEWGKAISIDSEIFALGCTLFRMETCRDPFHEFDDDERGKKIETSLQGKNMPALEKAPVLGKFIAKCWNLEYPSISSIVSDIRASTQATTSQSHI